MFICRPYVTQKMVNQQAWSAESYSGVLRVNHPYRVLLIRADQNMITYFGRSMDVHYTRLDYPIITKDDVMYVPLAFLGDYLNMQVAYGDNGRIETLQQEILVRMLHGVRIVQLKLLWIN